MRMETKPLVEINQQALRVLYRELGVVDAVRFLRQFTVGLEITQRNARRFLVGRV